MASCLNLSIDHIKSPKLKNNETAFAEQLLCEVALPALSQVHPCLNKVVLAATQWLGSGREINYEVTIIFQAI